MTTPAPGHTIVGYNWRCTWYYNSEAEQQRALDKLHEEHERACAAYREKPTERNSRRIHRIIKAIDRERGRPYRVE